MKFSQKLVLVPIEEWEKIKDKKSTEKNQIVTVNRLTLSQQKVPVHQKIVNQNPMKAMKQKGMGVLENSIQKISNPYKERIISLLRYLKKNPNISWNKNFEFQFKNKTFTNSNIIKLLKHAVHKSYSKPKAMKEFYITLSTLSIPKYILVNKKGRSIIRKKLTEKNDKWRPPGKLVKQ